MISNEKKKEFREALNNNTSGMPYIATDDLIFLQQFVLDELFKKTYLDGISPLAFHKDNDVLMDYIHYTTESINECMEILSAIDAKEGLCSQIRSAINKEIEKCPLTVFYLRDTEALRAITEEFRNHFDKSSAISLFKNIGEGEKASYLAESKKYKLKDTAYFQNLVEEGYVVPELLIDFICHPSFDDWIYGIPVDSETMDEILSGIVSICTYGLNKATGHHSIWEIDEEETKRLIANIGIDVNNLSKDFIKEVAYKYNSNFVCTHELEEDYEGEQ